MRKDAGKKAFILLVAAVVLIVAGCGSGKPFSYAVVTESTEEEQADEERGDEGGAKRLRPYSRTGRAACPGRPWKAILAGSLLGNMGLATIRFSMWMPMAARPRSSPQK